MNKVKKLSIVFVALLISGLVFSGCGTTTTDDSGSTDQNSDTTDTNDTSHTNTNNDDEEEEDADTDNTGSTQTDFSHFSEDDQSIGTSAAGSEYTLTQIVDTSMAGYHRFEFKLQSSKTTLPKIETSLVSSEQYISIKLDRVTSDQSGIAYQSARDIDENGVLRLYHGVTPIQTEELYQIGISKDAEFYLHAGSGLSVILDVKYPGESSSSGSTVTDPETFSSGTQTLSGTNTVGDVKISTYSWSIESDVLKFIWTTSAPSGNATPATSAAYSSKKITVTFGKVQTDLIAGGGLFESALADVATRVTGTKEADGDIVYTFTLAKDSTYRIYRTSSPNQVVLEIKR